MVEKILIQAQIISRTSVEGGSGTAAKLWSKVMRQVHENLTVTKFKVPDNVYFTRINLIDGGRTSGGSNAAFIEGTAPSRYTSYPSAPQKPKEEEKPETPENPDEGQETTPPPTDGGGETVTPPPTDNGGGNSNSSSYR